MNQKSAASRDEPENTGRIALVTGGASGIGAAVSRQLAQSGANVVVCDIDEVASIRLTDEIVSAGGLATSKRMDVSDARSVERVLEEVRQTFGGLDLAVNNAGITGALAPTGRLPLETWHRVMDINLNGLFYCLRFELPLMEGRPGAAIVNLSSILGLNGMPGTAAYSASKHGVIGLTKTCALDYATRGIRVNAVAPGYVDTPLLADDPKLREKLTTMHPMGRIAAASEIADLVVFLLSSRASFITGSVHSVDGAYSSR